MSKTVAGSETAAKKPAEKPVSLHPLEFEEAVAELLKVKPKRATEDKTSRSGKRDGG